MQMVKRKSILLILFVHLYGIICAHTGYESQQTLKQWTPLTSAGFHGYFMMLKADTAWIEDPLERIHKIALADLSPADKAYIADKWSRIERMNQNAAIVAASTDVSKNPPLGFYSLGLFGILLLVGFGMKFLPKRPPIVIRIAVSISLWALVVGFFPLPPQTDPSFIDSAFAPFKPKVVTRWDSRYFYVESQGIPSHPMMSGITSWQQQVPIPQCYTGANAWSIPLTPIIASTPIPTATNFFRGAIAIAANGVPIFNAYNNRGEDAYLIGELDRYGGHCGRADDYHYHIAPLSLDSINSDILPIAFALDGFAVYASKEPDGTDMSPLDANHGHYFNGVYHYHGTSSYPYMIGNMVGVVTKDATDQIIPQPSASPVRPALTALRGASITDCRPNVNGNGYNLSYLLNGQNYNVNYSWNTNGIYTFNFISPTGTTTSTYNGFRPCALSTAVLYNISEQPIVVYPNPTRDGFTLQIQGPYNINDIQSILLYDMQGRLVYQEKGYLSYYYLPNMAPGTYHLALQLSKTIIHKKLFIHE